MTWPEGLQSLVGVPAGTPANKTGKPLWIARAIVGGKSVNGLGSTPDLALADLERQIGLLTQ
jgi:hypothetical protein